MRQLRTERAAEAARLRGEGWSLRKIGDALGITPPTVLDDLAAAGASGAAIPADTTDGTDMNAFMRRGNRDTDDRHDDTPDVWMRRRAGTLETDDTRDRES